MNNNLQYLNRFSQSKLINRINYQEDSLYRIDENKPKVWAESKLIRWINYQEDNLYWVDRYN